MNSTSATIKDLSTFRSAIMGMAILFIMGYHSGLIWHGGFGVEMFLIMSGIGINYSLSKANGLSKFYLKRIIRILPCYLICGSLFYLLVKDYNLRDYAWAISMCSFWIDGVKYAWYIPVILFYYLISPLVYKCRVNHIILLICLIILFLFLYNDVMPKSIVIMLRRFPSYLIGFVIGKLLLNNDVVCGKVLKPYIGVVSVIVGYAILVAIKILGIDDKTYLIFPYLMLAIGLSHIVVVICKHSSRSRTILEAFGTVSLEIYMIHEFFFLIPLRPYITNNLLMFLLTVPISYFVALLTHKAIICMTRNQ